MLSMMTQIHKEPEFSTKIQRSVLQQNLQPFFFPFFSSSNSFFIFAIQRIYLQRRVFNALKIWKLKLNPSDS